MQSVLDTMTLAVKLSPQLDSCGGQWGCLEWCLHGGNERVEQRSLAPWGGDTTHDRSSLCSCQKEGDRGSGSQVPCDLRQGWGLLICKGELYGARICIWKGLEAATYLEDVFVLGYCLRAYFFI